MNIYIAPMIPGLFSGMVSEAETVTQSTMAYEQKDSKPAIDDVICHYLDGSTLKNALSFIDYVRASKMKIKWSAANVWSVRYKNKHVLDIIVKQDAWRVRLVLNHIAETFIFTNSELEHIRSLVNVLRNSMPENLEPTLALS